MINFHKYGFLDAKRLFRLINENEIWLNRCNPIWLFIWSNYYKPEIAFEADYIFIRYLLPGTGITYFPPIGNNPIEEGLRIIRADAKENGLDLSIAPINDDTAKHLEMIGYTCTEEHEQFNYIYSAEELLYKTLRSKKFGAIKFEKNHKQAYYKKIKKEDFPEVLGFIENWHLENLDDTHYFQRINMIKEAINHMYEFNMLGIILRDEEKIYGFALGSFVENVAFLELEMTLKDEIGAKEELLISFVKESLLQSKFINLGEAGTNKERISLLKSYKPLQVEKIYSTKR